MIDLHTHSRRSDGQDTPSELVKKAAEAGITVLALTDHDTASGVYEAQEAGKALGVQVVSGIEISAAGYEELHILGYGVRPDDAGLHEFTERNNESRKYRSRRIIDFLNASGIPITLEEVRQHNDGKCSGRPHFAAALVKMGYVQTVEEAFQRYLSTPEYYQIEREKPSAEQGIEMIRNAGGVAVLAHPCSLKLTGTAFCEVLEKLISCGLTGMECYYSKHTPEQIQAYLALAKRYGLIVTCGSDYHGPLIKPSIQLGRGMNDNLLKAQVPEQAIIEALYEKINIIR